MIPMGQRLVLFLALVVGVTHGFVPRPRRQVPQLVPGGGIMTTITGNNNKKTRSLFQERRGNARCWVSTLVLCASPNQPSGGGGKQNKNSNLEEGIRNKLLTETIAPWRAVRLFFYFGLGSGAFVGGLITLSGTLAALSGARSDVDLNAEYVNLAIDFGAVLVFALLARFDLQKDAELSQQVVEKVQQKKERSKQVQALKEREQQLYNLNLSVQVSPSGETRDVPVKELQLGAKQHMILVAGPRKACRDALVGANLLKMDFALNNVLVVPYDVDLGTAEARSRPGRPSGGAATGFGDRPAYETQPYVAWPVGEGWDAYVSAEIQDAIKQNGEKAREEGIAIVVANDGKIIRRGVGKVPWRQMVEELEQSVKGGGGETKKASLF